MFELLNLNGLNLVVALFTDGGAGGLTVFLLDFVDLAFDCFDSSAAGGDGNDEKLLFFDSSAACGDGKDERLLLR